MPILLQEKRANIPYDQTRWSAKRTYGRHYKTVGKVRV